jgi:hypothetical protein
MNSETPSTSIQRSRAGANPPAVITADCRMRLQDQRNSRDVVLFPVSSAGLRESRPGHGRPLRAAPGQPGAQAA